MPTSTGLLSQAYSHKPTTVVLTSQTYFHRPSFTDLLYHHSIYPQAYFNRPISAYRHICIYHHIPTVHVYHISTTRYLPPLSCSYCPPHTYLQCSTYLLPDTYLQIPTTTYVPTSTYLLLQHALDRPHSQAYSKRPKQVYPSLLLVCWRKPQ